MTKSLRTTLPLVGCAAVAVYLGEVLVGLWFGARWPLPLWYFLLGCLMAFATGVLVAVIATLLRTLSDRPVAAWAIFCWAVVMVKLFVPLGMQHPAPFLVLSLPFLLYGVLLFNRRVKEGSRVSWSLLTTLAAVISTDLYHSLGMLLEGGGWRAWATASLTVVLILMALGVQRDLERLGARLDPGFSSAAWGFLTALILTAMVWSSSGTVSRWNQTSYYDGPPVRGDLEEKYDRADRPDVIMISVDGLRHPRFDPELDSLPHLRELRRDSLVFDRVFSTSSWALPSHASLMTGRLPEDHGAVSHIFTRIRSPLVSYPQVLRAAGYRTRALTGGGHLRPTFGFARGFQNFWQQPEAQRGFVPGGLEFAARVLRGTEYRFPVLYRNHRGPYARSSDPIFERARRLLRSPSSPEQPQFLFLHTNELRDYQRPDPGGRSGVPSEESWSPSRSPEAQLPDPVPSRVDRERFLTRIPSFSDTEWERFRSRVQSLEPADWKRTLLGYQAQLLPAVPRMRTQRRIAALEDETWTTFLSWSRKDINYITDWNLSALARLRALSREKLQERRARYRRVLRSVDRKLGEFLQFLQDHDRYRDSLIVLLSGHGEGFSRDPLVVGHGLRRDLDQHGQLHDVLLRVPLWIKLPGNRGGGETRPERLQITDVFPSLLDHLGIVQTNPRTTDRFGRATELVPSEGERSTFDRDLVRGSVQSGKSLAPKFFVRSSRYKLTVDAAWELREYWRVPEEHHRDFLFSRAVPSDERERLRGTMSGVIEDFLHSSNPYPELSFQAQEFLRNQIHHPTGSAPRKGPSNP